MAKDDKLPGVIRGKPPCAGCTDRYITCHDHCPKDDRGDYGYLAWKNDIENLRKNRMAYEALNRRKSWQRTNTQKD